MPDKTDEQQSIVDKLFEQYTFSQWRRKVGAGCGPYRVTLSEGVSPAWQSERKELSLLECLRAT